MKPEEISTKLCIYDPRNPCGIYSYPISREEFSGLPKTMKKGCRCSRCSCGMAQLADFALFLLDEIEELKYHHMERG